MADRFFILVGEALPFPPLSADYAVPIGSPFGLDVDHSIAADHLLQIVSGKFSGIRDIRSDGSALKQQLRF
ncbi:hypothetical protein D3C81_1764790 [compost metagenome]